MTPRLIVLYCGLLMTIGAFSIDITLPSFPDMAVEFATSADTVKLTVTVYIASIGFGQLFWGAASDRFGRRPMLMAGLAIFFVGGVIAVFAADIWTLIGARVLQGVGGAAGVVISRAIIRDLYSGRDLAHNMALAMAVFAAGPIVAPLLGALIAEMSSWRFVFAAISVFAALLLVVAAGPLPETSAFAARDAMRPATLWRRTKRVLGHPQSRFFVLLSGVIMSTMIFIVASVPALYERQFGITGMLFAALFALHGVGVVIGQLVNRRLIMTTGTEAAMLAAVFVLLASSAAILGAALAGFLSPVLLSALLVLFATSYLIVYSNAASLVLDPNGDIAGFTASFYGFVSQIGAALIVSALTLLLDETAVVWSLILASLCGICTVAIAWWVRFRPQAPQAAGIPD